MENEVKNSDEMEKKEPSLLPQKPSPIPPNTYPYPPKGRESEQREPPPTPPKEGRVRLGQYF